LKAIDVAAEIGDLLIPAGNRLELLKGNQAERHSIRINDQYRVTLRRGMHTKSVSRTIIRDPSWLGPPVSPGEMLLEEFLKPMGLGQTEAARLLGISLNRLNEIVLGKRSIIADTALRLARLFKMSPQFWMRLQADWDLQQAIRKGSKLEKIERDLAQARRKNAPA
jgi:addiction module HigA family antidote